MLVKCRFLDEDEKPKGKDYVYSTMEDLTDGEIACTPEGAEVVITEIDVPKSEAAGMTVKSVSRSYQGELVQVDIPQIDLDSLIVIEQLPVITEQLVALSAKIDADVEDAISRECTEKDKQAIKKIRARLNKDFTALEERRKIVKKAISGPYVQFEAVYKECVTEKYGYADTILKNKIAAVEDEQKESLRNYALSLYSEYAASKKIDFITFEKSGIEINLSSNKTSLSKQIKTFLDKVLEDLKLIALQDHADEILVEYKESLNCSQAITKVINRHKLIEDERQKQAENEAQIAIESEAVERVDAALLPRTVAPPTIESAKQEQDDDPVLSITFKVTATKSKLRALKQFLIDGGYDIH